MERYIVLIGIVFALSLYLTDRTRLSDALRVDPDPEVLMNAIIERWGYPAESYDVTTEDGYILRLLRIPHGKEQNSSGERPVVFMQHGLMAECSNWIINLPNESLGFVAADAGFDVWLGNSRGNAYSDKHVKYNKTQVEFWDFSWDQMAAYDLPTSIDFITSKTGQSSVFYVGHSQGTLTAFAELSRNVSFASKIKKVLALAPIGRVSHIEGPLKIIAAIGGYDPNIFYELFGHKVFLPNSTINDWLAETVCDSSIRWICRDTMFLFAGVDTKETNMSRIPVYISHATSGTSVEDMMHFVQMANSGKIQAYDYGSKELNIKHYGQATPPLYDFTKIPVPVVTFAGGHDWLADPQDVKDLLPMLKHLEASYEYPSWNHLDFVYAYNTTKLNAQILQHLKN